MGHVGRHARSFRSPLGFSLRSAFPAPSAIVGEFCGGAANVGSSRGMNFGARGGLLPLLLGRRFYSWASFPRSFSSASDALSSCQFPRGIQATSTGLGSGFHYQQKAKFKLVAPVRLQCEATYASRCSQDSAQGKRWPEGNNGKVNAAPESPRVLCRTVQGGGGSLHVQSANALNEAIEVLKNRLQQGFITDSYTYVEVLKWCLKQKDLMAAKQVHDCIVNSRMEQDTYVVNNLLSVYMRCGKVQEARRVFDALVKKDVYSWNIMIGGYAQHSHAKDAMGLFDQMCQDGVQPNAVTYLIILKACVDPSALRWGRKVHAHIRHGGLESDVRVGTALLKMYAKCGCMKEARHIFNNLTNRDVFSWNVMIDACADSGFGKEAYQLFLQMKREGFKPDAITYTSILNACASAGALKWVKEVHRLSVEAGLESDGRVGNALVHVYTKCGNIDYARLLFDRMQKRDVVTWTLMIKAYAESGRGEEAYRLFLQMKQEGLQPDAITFLSVLDACASVGILDWVKEVHRHILEAGLESDVRVGSALVHMYGRSGSMDDARLVFDKMKERNAVTWTAMIGAYSQNGNGQEAYRLLLQMDREGFKPNAITYVSILDARASAGALDWVKEVHRHILEAGLESDVRVGSALVHMYAKSGSIDDAQLVFYRMKKRNVFTWTAMIGGLAEHGRGCEAYEFFLRMQREGCVPDATTYVSILNACPTAVDLDWVKKIHRHALEAGLEKDLRVGNALVHMYTKSESIADARLVFDRMEVRDVITWNIMIAGLAQRGLECEAYDLFLQMQREGCVPDETTYATILNACASAGALKWAEEIHRLSVDAGFDSDLRVGNALLHVYVNSGNFDYARLLFERMENRDVITWTLMIKAYAESGRGEEAYRLFLQMKQEGLQPDAIAFLSVLDACASAGILDWVKEVHRHILEAGLESDVRVGSALVHVYGRSGSIHDARLVFDRMKERNAVTWTAMIGAYAKNGNGKKAYQLLLQMDREGFKPNAITYVSILDACASAGALDWVKEVHRHILEAGLESDVSVGNALVHMYAKSGSIADARLVFDSMEVHNIITWNVMIGGLAEDGRGCEAYELFLQMQREGCVPDAITYLNILNACASAGALDWVKEVHMHALEAGLESDVRVGSALVRMYVKSGSIDDARVVFGRMKERDVITWTVMIGGLAQHGLGREALEVFRDMIADGVKPDAHTFVAVLSACSHSGLVDEGCSQYLAMTRDYGIEPDVLHYTCMVDLLGRAGRLEEAKLFIANMAVEPNEATWGALLGACRTYGNVELGELAAKELLNLDPEDASAYVLLSNIYAGAGKWDMVASVRTMMHERGIRKEPGRSWIEIDNKIHDFVVADLSHTERKEIYENRDKVIEKIKAEGYIPDTRLVLKNMDEEDKELNICSHSEKLAIAYGLMHTPAGKPIRVFKNLRVCTDCHTATKFISRVEGREIIVRDAHRFHRFKDGVCSCGDYW